MTRHGNAGSGSVIACSRANEVVPAFGSRTRGTPKTATTSSAGIGPFVNTVTVWDVVTSAPMGFTNAADVSEKLGMQSSVGRSAVINDSRFVSRKSRQIRSTTDQSVLTNTRITSP